MFGIFDDVTDVLKDASDTLIESITLGEVSNFSKTKVFELLEEGLEVYTIASLLGVSVSDIEAIIK